MEYTDPKATANTCCSGGQRTEVKYRAALKEPLRVSLCRWQPTCTFKQREITFQADAVSECTHLQVDVWGMGGGGSIRPRPPHSLPSEGYHQETH